MYNLWFRNLTPMYTNFNPIYKNNKNNKYIMISTRMF